MTEDNWRSMDLAPKDGTVIQGKMFDGWRKDGRQASLTRNTWFQKGAWRSSKGKWEPTLWQPAAKAEINRSKYA